MPTKLVDHLATKLVVVNVVKFHLTKLKLILPDSASSSVELISAAAYSSVASASLTAVSSCLSPVLPSTGSSEEDPGICQTKARKVIIIPPYGPTDAILLKTHSQVDLCRARQVDASWSEITEKQFCHGLVSMMYIIFFHVSTFQGQNY